MKSYIKEPCYILIGCISFFTSLSFFSSTYTGLKQYDFLADVKQDKHPDKLETPPVLVAEKGKAHPKKSKKVSKESSPLEPFFAGLDSLKTAKKKIRIAHFGDSMIEGDLITSTLREEFQKEFGGSGVGFVLASPLNASFRQSISQEFSDNWETVNIKDHQKAYDIGLSGYTSVTKGNSWIRFSSKNTTELLKVYYGNSTSDSSLSVEVNSVKNNLPTTKLFNEFSRLVNATDVSIRFTSAASVPVYGLSLESDSGVIMDNFSFRGSSGTYFKEYNKALLMQFQEHLRYDLIILQYGINAANNKTTDYSWYKRQMLANINYVKEAFPGTPILMIGCSDRAVKTNGTYATSKGIEPLIETQKELAQQTGSGFLNFYELMGGKGSMEKWVTGDTCFANKDYTHFNHKGAAKAGKLIYQSIIADYKNRNTTHEITY